MSTQVSVAAVGFIPEIKFKEKIKRKISISPDLFIIPETDKRVEKIKESLEKLGYQISEGLFLYYQGSLKEDGTLYEIFQSYSLALTFFYEGRATCRAYQKNVDGTYHDPEIFIDPDDKFRFDLDDERILSKKDIKKISSFYDNISSLLQAKSFNPLVNSLEFFGRFLKENDIRLRLLYLNICLENLFSNISNSEAIGYKLGMRCAYLLGNKDKTVKKSVVYEEVRDGYNLRSTIIHGNDYKKASQKIINAKKRTEIDHILILEKILKRAYFIIFKDKNFYSLCKAGTLGQNIDKEILSK